MAALLQEEGLSSTETEKDAATLTEGGMPPPSGGKARDVNPLLLWTVRRSHTWLEPALLKYMGAHDQPSPNIFGPGLSGRNVSSTRMTLRRLARIRRRYDVDGTAARPRPPPRKISSVSEAEGGHRCGLSAKECYRSK